MSKSIKMNVRRKPRPKADKWVEQRSVKAITSKTKRLTFDLDSESH